MSGEVLLVVLVVGLVALGIGYIAKPEFFSKGWLWESKVALPSPARNRGIGVVLVLVGIVAGSALAWAWFGMRP